MPNRKKPSPSNESIFSDSLLKKVRQEIEDQTLEDLSDSRENSEAYESLKMAKNTNEAVDSIYKYSEIGEYISKDTLQSIFNEIYKNEKRSHYHYKDEIKSLAPFCHGTSSYNADKIKEEGLKPRIQTGVSNWHEDALDSSPDRVYLGVNTVHGLKKCIGGAFKASEFPEGEVILFDKSVSDLETVSDEDCVVEKTFITDPFESGYQCGSFGVRETVPPDKITEIVHFDPKTFKSAVKRLCKNTKNPKCVKDLEKEAENYF